MWCRDRPGVVRAVAHRETDLGRQQDVVALVADGLAQDLLGTAPGVHVGGVEQVHPGVEAHGDLLLGPVQVDGADPLEATAGAEPHGSQRQHGHIQTGRSQASIFHACQPTESESAQRQPTHREGSPCFPLGAIGVESSAGITVRPAHAGGGRDGCAARSRQGRSRSFRGARPRVHSARRRVTVRIGAGAQRCPRTRKDARSASEPGLVVSMLPRLDRVDPAGGAGRRFPYRGAFP